jgi:hypothetical protein
MTEKDAAKAGINLFYGVLSQILGIFTSPPSWQHGFSYQLFFYFIQLTFRFSLWHGFGFY